jgi:putative endonuclease
MAGLVPAIPLRQARRVRQFYLYILASRPGGAIYVGVTSDLVRRVYEHRNGFVEGHTKRFHIHQLVYFEVFSTARRDSTREEHEALAACLEDAAHHAKQSDVARSLRRDRGIVRH